MPGFEVRQKNDPKAEQRVDTSFIDLVEGRLDKSSEQPSDMKEAARQAEAARAEVAEQAAAQESADAAAAQEILARIKSTPDMRLDVVPEDGRVADGEKALAEASLINQYVDRRSADGKPLDAEALRNLGQMQSEEVDKRIAGLNTEAGKKYLSGELSPAVEVTEQVVEVKTESLQELPQDPESIQAGEEALEYVSVIPESWKGENTRNLSISDRRGFEAALETKKFSNKNVRRKIALASASGALASFGGGAATMIFQGSGAAAVAGNLTLGGAMMLGGAGGFLILGAAGYGAKKLWDRYKERKARKNFEKASGRA